MKWIGKLWVLIVMLFFVSPISAEVVQTVVENIVYDIDLEKKEATCVGSKFKSTKHLNNAVIADEVEYEGEFYPVTCVGSYAFDVVASGSNARYGISGFLTLGKNIKKIERNAFGSCEITNERLILPESLETVGTNALSLKNKIDEIVFPKGFKEIAEGHTTGRFKRSVFLSEICPPSFNSYLGTYFYCVPQYMNDYQLKHPEINWKDAGLLSTNLTLDQTEVELKCNETMEMRATVEPDYLNECVKWSIEPAGIAYVDTKGQLTGLSSGVAILTAQCGDLKVDCIVKVQTSDSGNNNSGNNGSNTTSTIDSFVFMNPDETLKLTDFVQSDTTIVSWETSNDDVVDVTKKGNAESYEYGYSFVEGKDANGEIVTTVVIFVCPSISVEYSEGNSSYKHHVIYNSIPTLNIAAPEGYEIVSVKHDDQDITEIVSSNNGIYSPAEPVTANSKISVSLISTKDPADLNGDGKVDASDLNWLIDHMLNY